MAGVDPAAERTQRTKVELRRRLRLARRALSEGYRREAEARACQRLHELARARHARVVAVYAAHRSEADPRRFAERWLASGGVVVWPRVVDGASGALVFHQLPGPAALRLGYRGIEEPPASAPEVSPTALDLVVVPGLAFDRLGHRLGQGGGFYDRLLASPALRATTVGLAFGCQILAQVPCEAHDQRVAYVVTELGVADGGLWGPPDGVPPATAR